MITLNPLALSHIPEWLTSSWVLYPSLVLLMAACAWHAWKAR